jgi:hypothetical protein
MTALRATPRQFFNLVRYQINKGGMKCSKIMQKKAHFKHTLGFFELSWRGVKTL